MYKHLADKMIFEYFMIHSTRTKDIFCEKPFYIEAKYIKTFKESSETINDIVIRIIKGINDEFADFKDYISDFPFKSEILSLENPLAPLFWTRYDGFMRDDNKGVFYSELNYDKPCAQRECMVMEALYKDENNINNGFKKNFVENFYYIASKYFPDGKEISTAILTDPCHYEETHLALLFKDILTDEKHKFILVGPTNLSVNNDEVYAFGEKIHVVLKLFPTEYSSEINQFDNILKLFEKNKILMLNDPRVIIGQCKNLYTYLWNLVKTEDSRLSYKEKKVIESTLPYTEKLTKKNISLAMKDKNKYVIKPVYGRYSIDVFIGSIYSEEEWADAIKYIEEKMKEKEFILQEFCKINLETVPYYDGMFTISSEAYANLGIYLSNNQFLGACTRWNESYLTSDESTWITPIVEKEKNIIMEPSNLELNNIINEIVIDCSFSGSYVKNFHYLGLDPLIITKEKAEELKNIINNATKIFKKTENLIIDNIDLYADILGIGELKELFREKTTDEFSFIARIDCILDVEENWKIIEINAETPAGLCESLKIDELIFKKINNENYIRINDELEKQLVDQAKRIIEDYSKDKDIKTLAIVGSTYYEDWYTINSLYDVLKHTSPNIEVIIGSIYDMKVINDSVYLYGKKIDCMFRYYPLDWFDYEETEDLKKIKTLLNNQILSLNPITTIIPQSKAFFAVIYELLKYGFYSKAEEEIIKKHIPFTTFDLEQMPTPNFLVKPLLSREGQGIQLSYELREIPDEDCIFQEMVYAQTIKSPIYSNYEKWQENLYPIIGAYITGCEFAGVYTRLGSVITNNICMYAPIYCRD